MTPPYRPIACGVHDELLAIATLGRECRVSFLDGAGTARTARTRILDVYTKGTEEFLMLETGETVRLDALTRVEGTSLGG